MMKIKRTNELFVICKNFNSWRIINAINIGQMQ
jgi:hypothetical protein